MGNRAVITFDKKPTGNSLGIYLHWNGGAEPIVAFLDAADHYGVRDPDDSYHMARITQIISNYFGGILSVGVDRLERLDCDNYDNGVYIIEGSGKDRVIRQIKGDNLKETGKVIDQEAMRKDGNNILKDILAKNDEHFKEE